MLTCQKCGDDFPDGTRYCTRDGTLLEADSADLPPGTEVGEYRVTGKLGEGGMGAVYAGVQPVIGKKVAIKVLSPRAGRRRAMVQRFIQEARAVNRIGHPNIIDIFSFGQLPDGRHYFVMELLERQSLTRAARGAARSPFGEARRHPAARSATALGRGARGGHRPPRPQARQHLPARCPGTASPSSSCSTSASPSCSRSGGGDRRRRAPACRSARRCYMSPEQCRGARPSTTAPTSTRSA